MLKPLTLSVGLAVALCAGGVSLAGHKDCATCGLASPQASPQGVTASSQSYGCESPLHKKHSFFSGFGKMFKHEKTYTYEWVLKKKRVWGHKGGCSVCGSPVTASGQYASPQGGYSTPQATSIYGAAQTASSGVPSVGEITPATTPDEPPAPPATTEPAGEKPATATPGTAANGLLFSTPSGE